MGLLADRILAGKVAGPGRAALFRLDADLRSAHAFELAPGFAAAADQLRGSRPSAFDGIVHLARLPYPRCWFEVASADRDSFVRGEESTVADPGALDRIGVLATLAGEGSRRMLMQLFWSFADGRVTTSHFDALVSLEPHPEVTPALRLALAGRTYPPGEREAAERLHARLGLVPARLRADEVAAAPPGSAFRAAILANAEHDWAGEPQYWLAAIALLNARNVAATEPVDMAAANRRRRRAGSRRPDLLSYTRCVIAPRLRERMAEGAADGGQADARAHFVRGHFKCRRTGIFWWTPFIRGDKALGFVSKGYEVR